MIVRLLLKTESPTKNVSDISNSFWYLTHARNVSLRVFPSGPLSLSKWFSLP